MDLKRVGPVLPARDGAKQIPADPMNGLPNLPPLLSWEWTLHSLVAALRRFSDIGE